MKVQVLIKIKEHPQPESDGAQKDDIIEILPYDEILSRKTVNSFLPIIVDMNIPCGSKFSVSGTKRNYKCTSCAWNNPYDCDHIKYKNGIWDDGTIDQPPKLKKKRKYMIDRTEIDIGIDESLITKEINEDEKKTIIAATKANEQSLLIVKDKEE